MWCSIVAYFFTRNPETQWLSKFFLWVCMSLILALFLPKWTLKMGTDLERGYGDVRPWRPPFHASPAARKGPISSKRVSSQDPLLRKFGNFSLYSLNFHPNFSSQAPNLEIFSSQAPKFGNFPLTGPPFQRQMSVRKPHTLEIQAAHPYLKKSWVPPPPGLRTQLKGLSSNTPPSKLNLNTPWMFLIKLKVISILNWTKYKVISMNLYNSTSNYTVVIKHIQDRVHRDRSEIVETCEFCSL